MKILLVFLVLLLPVVPSVAAVSDVERQTRGYGASYQEALSSALLEAVRQVRGLEVGTEKTLKSTLMQSVGSGSAVIVGKERVSEDVYTKSQGWIKTYEILEVTEPTEKGGNWEVVALVTVPRYEESIKNDTRKTFAVLPFEIAFKNFVSKDIRFVSTDFSERVSEGIISELVQSRKFAVVNRAFEKSFNKEVALLKSSRVSSEEASRIGRKLGADYIMVGKIHSLNISEEVKEFYGMSKTVVNADVSLFYSVIEAATEKVMWADTVDYKHTDPGEDDLASSLVQGLSNNIVSNVMGVIYPVKILDIQAEDSILLNQGGRSLEVGLRMSVYTAGRSIADPDTGLPIKIDGNKVAEIEIVEVLPKYSIARLVDGEYTRLEVNAIVRPSKQTESAPQPARELTPGSSEKPWSW